MSETFQARMLDALDCAEDEGEAVRSALALAAASDARIAALERGLRLISSGYCESNNVSFGHENACGCCPSCYANSALNPDATEAAGR